MKYFSKEKQTSDTTLFTIKNVKVEFPFYIFVQKYLFFSDNFFMKLFLNIWFNQWDKKENFNEQT